MSTIGGDVPPDLERKFEAKREELGLNKSQGVRRAVSAWVDEQNRIDRVREHLYGAVTNLAILAIVLFVVGSATDLLALDDAIKTSWLLIAVGVGAVATLELREWAADTPRARAFAVTLFRGDER